MSDSNITYKGVVYAPDERCAPPISALLLYVLCARNTGTIHIIYADQEPLEEDLNLS
jgi:hypothetical protein